MVSTALNTFNYQSRLISAMIIIFFSFSYDKNALNVHFIKTVLDVTYYSSIELVALDKSVPVDQFASYKDNDCFSIIYLSRNKINLNLVDFKATSKFVEDCKEWIGQAYFKIIDYEY
jgi:hypothetical protein